MSNSDSWRQQGLVSLKLVGNTESLDFIPNLSGSVVWLTLGKSFLPLISSFSLPLIFCLISSCYYISSLRQELPLYIQRRRRPKLAIPRLHYKYRSSILWYTHVIFKQCKISEICFYRAVNWQRTLKQLAFTSENQWQTVGYSIEVLTANHLVQSLFSLYGVC